MSESEIRKNYILYIGAGAVATGGIISMAKAMPVIIGSIISGLRDLFGKSSNKTSQVKRTERELPFSLVIFGSLGMIVALMATPSLGLGFNLSGIIGACMILLFGFMFVTVSSRITGEIGSSSNPISGMTVCTLLLTCLILLTLSNYGILPPLSKEVKLLALTIAGVVCIACSNGGTTSQALKTGHLLGATPKNQTYAILVGSLTSALVVGAVLLLFNTLGTTYTKKDLPNIKFNVNSPLLQQTQKVKSGMYAKTDTNDYKVLIVGRNEKLPEELIISGNKADIASGGKFLIDADGTIAYRCDPAVTGSLKKEDDGTEIKDKFEAPKTQLVVLIIDGILQGDLPWNLVMIGALISITLELCGLPSLAFAVGVYLPLSSSMPIFIGGAVRWAVDKIRVQKTDDDSSSGVMLSSGYIAGGSIASLVATMVGFPLFEEFKKRVNCEELLIKLFNGKDYSDWIAIIAILALCLMLLIYGAFIDQKSKKQATTNPETQTKTVGEVKTE
jgi:uncharacterized oligopeptide transporter (OPT) family protein